MKQCKKCGQMLDDAAVYCTSCGAPLTETPQPVYQPSPQPVPAPAAHDHTAEFTAEDISSNKVIAMLVYLMGWIGILIALLASSTSKYAAFHVRQALKIAVVETLLPIALICGAVINIIPILGTIIYLLAAIGAIVLYMAFFVIKIICFFQICKGQAKEPAIIRNLKFLK